MSHKPPLACSSQPLPPSYPPFSPNPSLLSVKAVQVSTPFLKLAFLPQPTIGDDGAGCRWDLELHSICIIQNGVAASGDVQLAKGVVGRVNNTPHSCICCCICWYVFQQSAPRFEHRLCVGGPNDPGVCSNLWWL